MITSGNSFKLLLYYIFLEDRKYMIILTRQKKKDLYQILTIKARQSFNDIYTALILEEAEKLYNKLTTKLTNSVIAAAAADIEASSLPPSLNRKNDRL